jgi:FkbM family methyltransferase
MDIVPIRKAAYRAARWNPATELALAWWKWSPILRLSALGFETSVSPGDVLIDCGANVGDITAKFARTPGVVHAFEPDPVCYRVLRRRFQWIRNVQLHPQGVMDRDCVLTLVSPDPHAGLDGIETTVSSSFSTGKVRGTYSVRETRVECVDLVAFVRSVDHVRVLKLDIEGSELPVLNALLDSGAIDLVDHVIVETHEKCMPQLVGETEALRDRIAAAGLGGKICLDWY